jgi:toxin ParE1/3/4
MRYRVIVTSEALASVEELLDYIAIDQQSPLTAQRWWRKAYAAVMTLEKMPHRCPYAPENAHRDYTIRMLIVDRCMFIYTVDDEARVVRVIGFRHGSQLPQSDELPDNSA